MRSAAWLSVAIALFLALPILAVLASLVQPAGETWRHLASTVLSRYVGNTAALLVLVAAGVISIGVVSVWLVATYRFPGVRKADLVIDEITAHARGAVAIDPTVDTIFEIGGQDSKYISISNTYPLELDEHSAAAGVMTRLEAYQHVIGNSLRKNQRPKPLLRRAGWRKPQPAGAAPREAVMALCSK